MKVKCEYCQSMVDSREKYCPSCGSPLPEVPEPLTPRKSSQTTQMKPAGPRFLLLALVVIFAVGLTLILRFSPMSEPSSHPTESSASKAFARLEQDPTDVKAYRTIISYHLDQGKYSSALHYAQTLLLAVPDAEQGRWCVEQFRTFGLENLAVQLALFSDALTGEAALFPTVEDTPISALMPDSPLRQAMELFFGQTADRISLSDLQTITFLSVYGEDPLAKGRRIEVGTAPDGSMEHPTALMVESDHYSGDLGLIYFQGLKRLAVQHRGLNPKELLLPSLFSLSMGGGQLDDLTPLHALKHLERLSIVGCNLQSLNGLDKLTALQSLTLVDTKLSDLSLLSAQKGLTKLSLIDNDNLTGVPSLAQMTQLTDLTLEGEPLVDLSPIGGLTGLTRLSVRDTSIRSTGFLSGLTNLEELELYDNEHIESVPELTALPKLTRLRLQSDEDFASPADVAALRQLKSLSLLSYKDLSYLAPLTNLEELELCFTRSEIDLGPLASFQKLRRLRFEMDNSFYSTYKGDLSHLSALKNLPLEELDMGGHRTYEALDPILSISTLKRLDLSHFFAEGTDFTKFSNLTQLEELNLSGFRDMVDTPPGPGELYWSYEAGPADVFLQELGRLPALKWLDLSGCKAKGIPALSGLTTLVSLNLADNDISDLSPLTGCTALTYLNASNNPIADYSPVENREGLILIR